MTLLAAHHPTYQRRFCPARGLPLLSENTKLSENKTGKYNTQWKPSTTTSASCCSEWLILRAGYYKTQSTST